MTSPVVKEETLENDEESFKVKAIVSVKLAKPGFLSSLSLDRRIDDIIDLLGKSLLLELVSSQLDPGTYFIFSCFLGTHFNLCILLLAQFSI